MHELADILLHYTLLCLILHRNVCRKLRKFSKHQHQEDAISVDRIVNELKQKTISPVLYYKSQGVKDPDLTVPATDTCISTCNHDQLPGISL